MKNQMKICFQNEFGVLYNEDALNVLKQLPDESIDFILTDPPFFISQEIKIARSGNYKYKGKDIDLDFGEWDKQWKTEKEYLEWCYTWLKECVRILKPYRHLVFFFDKKKISYVCEFLEQNDMKFRSLLFWLKSNPVPRARKVDFMKALEMALWFTKGKVKSEFFNWQLGQHPDYVIAGLPNKPRYHPTQKPEKVLEVWIKYLSKEGDIVLDPFCGSGTTLIVSQKLNRRFIGIEKEEKYCQIAEKRINSVKSGKNQDFNRLF